MRRIIFLFYSLLIISSSTAQSLHFVKPSDTDPEIDRNDNNHIAYLNESAELKNELFVFLPGTGGLPVFYTFIQEEAADLGYHTIGLTYPNDTAINSIAICGLTVDTTCHSRARHEIFDGIDRHENVDVNPANSIQNRLFKLLFYLDQQWPEEGWGQYFEGTNILWNKIKIAGHSQGGGHAGFIATLVPLERAIMIGSNDRIALLGRNADWFKVDGATPNDRYFGLLHFRDELVDFDNAISAWDDRGMIPDSPLVNVDTSASPYWYSKTLYTDITPRNDEEKFHGTIAVDAYTPLDMDGNPVLAPVWRHLIDSADIVDQLNQLELIPLRCFPNPADQEIYLDGFVETTDLDILLISLDGMFVRSDIELSPDFSIDLSSVFAGSYCLLVFEKGLAKYMGQFIKI